MPFIIGISDGEFSSDYYGGKTYVHQGERFPSRVRRHEAKQYKRKSDAEKSVEALNRKCASGDLFFVIPVTD